MLRTLPLLVLAFAVGGCGAASQPQSGEPPSLSAASEAAAADDGSPFVEEEPAAGPENAIAVTIRVLTPEGDPVVGQTVRADDPRGRGCIGSYAFAEGETDEQGVVVLTGLDPEKPCDLEIHRWVTEDRDLGGHYEKDWLPRNRDVVLVRYYSARGRVLDLDGHPISGAVVLSTDPDRNYTRDSGPDGRFEFAGIRQGDIVHVKAMPRKSYGIPGEVIPLAAGGEEVEIRIERGEKFLVRVRNWPSEKDVPGYRNRARMTNLDDPQMQHLASVSEDGTIRFAGLRPEASYALWVPRIGESPLHFYRSGLRVGDGPLEVDLVPGGSIRVTVRSTKTHRRMASVVGPGFAVSGRTLEEHPEGDAETILIKGVPRGTWEVVAESGGTKTHLENERRVQARTGDNVEVVLPEPPRR